MENSIENFKFPIGKTPYVMFKLPTETYAIKYCEENKLILGEVYYLVEQPDMNSVFIKISDNKASTVGKVFFKEHFKISLRTININKLL